MKKLSHLDERDRPRMVDVSGKDTSYRAASAHGTIKLNVDTVKLIAAGRMRKGSVLTTAELAGIQAAKETARLIPLCHPLQLTKVAVEATLRKNGVDIVSEVKCTGQTGVEMEALTAVSVALLTVYDMCKAVDKNMEISGVRLLTKTKRSVS